MLVFHRVPGGLTPAYCCIFKCQDFPQMLWTLPERVLELPLNSETTAAPILSSRTHSATPKQHLHFCIQTSPTPIQHQASVISTQFLLPLSSGIHKGKREPVLQTKGGFNNTLRFNLGALKGTSRQFLIKKAPARPDI